MCVLIAGHTAMSTAIALALSELSTEAEIIEEPYPTIPYYPVDRPASSKYAREKDWEQPRSKNQYKRRGR